VVAVVFAELQSSTSGKLLVFANGMELYTICRCKNIDPELSLRSLCSYFKPTSKLWCAMNDSCTCSAWSVQLGF
jgi:hypothetical protein